MMVFKKVFLVFILALLMVPHVFSQEKTKKKSNEPSKLVVVWTSGDREVALKMVFMYTYNAKLRNWWDEVQLIVWGPSTKLLSEDSVLQEHIKKMKDAGVILTSCKACADSYGVSDSLGKMGIDVKYMGVPFTDMLKTDWKVITF